MYVSTNANPNINALNNLLSAYGFLTTAVIYAANNVPVAITHPIKESPTTAIPMHLNALSKIIN